MRWPWSKGETRQSNIGGSGNFSDQVIRLIEAEAAQKAVDAGTTAAVEAAAGALSRAFMSAEVDAEDWVQEIVDPGFLALTARNWVRAGASMHSIEMGASGRPWLASVAFWNWENAGNADHPADKRNWRVRATSYGPSSSKTRLLPWDGVVYTTWGSSPGTTYIGAGPLGFASTTARLMAETERSLTDEARGAIANLIPHPKPDSSAVDADGNPVDPLAALKADLAAARGRPVFVETLRAGLGQGQASAPQKDWIPSRLGPNPPEAMVEIAKQSFERILAACGMPAAIWTGDAAQASREALRLWHQNTVRPLARMLEHELEVKLEADLKLQFDNYPLDLAGRAQAFQKLVAGGVGVNEALATSGLLADG